MCPEIHFYLLIVAASLLAEIREPWPLYPREQARGYKTNFRTRAKNAKPDPQWLIAQPRGEEDPTEQMFLYAWDENQRGEYYLATGRPSVAVWYLERKIILNVRLEDRFNSELALHCYNKLSKAYRRKAELFRLNTFSLYRCEPSRTQEVAAAVRKYLDEHRAEEIPEAEQLAEHYRLKTIVVEAYLVAKNPLRPRLRESEPGNFRELSP